MPKRFLDKERCIYSAGHIKLYGKPKTKSYACPRDTWKEDILIWDNRRYRHWSTAIKKPDHIYNWGGIALGVIGLLKEGKIKFDRGLLMSFDKDWRPDIARAALIGLIAKWK